MLSASDDTWDPHRLLAWMLLLSSRQPVKVLLNRRGDRVVVCDALFREPEAGPLFGGGGARDLANGFSTMATLNGNGNERGAAGGALAADLLFATRERSGYYHEETGAGSGGAVAR